MAHVEGRDPGSQLADAVHHWVEAGIVTPAQADAIFEFERAQAVEPLQPAERREGRLPLATELLSYLGIALVIMSGTFLVTRFWSDLHIGGRVAVGLVAAVVGLLGSTVVTRIGGRGACRLGSFLALCGTGGVALTVGLAAVALGSHSSTVVLAVGWQYSPSAWCCGAMMTDRCHFSVPSQVLSRQLSAFTACSTCIRRRWKAVSSSGVQHLRSASWVPVASCARRSWC